MFKARLVTLLLAAPLLLALPFPSDPSQQPDQPQSNQPQSNQPQLDQSQSDQSQQPQRPIDKISFDLSALSDQGLIAHQVSLSYEFCVPASEAHWTEVKSIDPSVQIFQHSKGRIGCRADQSLCIGNTHQPNWRSILLQLVELAYVERIDQVFWE